MKLLLLALVGVVAARAKAENTLIDVPYTLVRPGPCVECHRVGGCDAAGQGCRTKALLPYRTTCHRLAAEIDNTRS